MHMCSWSHGFAKIPGISDPSLLIPFGIGYRTKFESQWRIFIEGASYWFNQLASCAGKESVRLVSSTMSLTWTVTKTGSVQGGEGHVVGSVGTEQLSRFCLPKKEVKNSKSIPGTGRFTRVNTESPPSYNSKRFTSVLFKNPLKVTFGFPYEKINIVCK